MRTGISRSGTDEEVRAGEAACHAATYWGRPCDTGTVSLEESADRVVVTAYRTVSDPYQMCAELATGPAARGHAPPCGA